MKNDLKNILSEIKKIQIVKTLNETTDSEGIEILDDKLDDLITALQYFKKLAKTTGTSIIYNKMEVDFLNFIKSYSNWKNIYISTSGDN